MNKKSTITSGSAKEKTKRVVKTQREKNILWGNKFLRGLAKALKTPGVKLNLPADAPLYHANDNGQLVRVLNGEESTGVMKNGLFVPDEVKTSRHTIDYCDHCKGFMIVCGTCGNNTCNGGYGEIDGKDCMDCRSAYEKHVELHF